MKRLTLIQRIRGWTLTELMMAAAISGVLVTGLLIGAASIQRSYFASRHHVDSQAQQMRLMDFMNLDLRRALSVTTESERLVVRIPDFYGNDGEPRDPQIVRGQAIYGATPKKVEYYREGSAIFRKEGDVRTELATEVTDFKLVFKDLGQSIMVSVTFLPKFQFSGSNAESVRGGTATFSTTLLRNKRQD
jgi:prepilin-type N-terminal cleavage/methylation domain-containing protein